jgi:hypothetical protein
MRTLILLHRWLGVAFCLLFAMWFASGMVMHFVPFPALRETDRIAGLAPIDPAQIVQGPAAAVAASAIIDAARVRLIARPDGPVYLVTGPSGVAAVHSVDLSVAAVASAQLALQIAVDHAARRGLPVSNAAVAGRAAYDQWTVPNGFDRHRPLFRVALNDAAGTELYVSAMTGEVMLGTTRHQRLWNYAGSVVHWIYPTVLRSHWAAWDRVVWTLSLAALLAAASGALLGTLRIRTAWRRLVVPMRSWHAWHHVLGLLTMTFILTWSVSGWLSMDHGRLFSPGTLTDTETAISAAEPTWTDVAPGWMRQITPGTREIEWFALGRATYQRDRIGLAEQVLRQAPSATASPKAFLTADDIGDWIRPAARDCAISVVTPDDNYAASSMVPAAPVYRAVCGPVWFHIDGASGVMIERLDASRRAYRWAYGALHTMNVPVLLAHPMLRSVLILGLCGCGFVFSITGVVIGWRRIRAGR